jgi:tetratricopeptide (TPR) repeat protein
VTSKVGGPAPMVPSRALWLLAGTLLAGAGGGAVAMLFSREPAPPTGGADPVGQGTATGVSAQERLAGELSTLRSRIDRLEIARDRSEVTDASALEAAVERVLQRRAEAASSSTIAGTSGVAGAAVGDLLRELALAPPGPRADELWARVRAAGGLDAAVEYFERLAATNPGSPEAQTSLGLAYIQKMLSSSEEQERIELGRKVDAAFDRALEVAPDHWEARFRKAVGLSHGQALSGRRSEAIAQFERLVQQQSNGPSQPGWSQTYLYLGRLYAEGGQAAKAAELWRMGLQRHPDDPELRAVVQGIQGAAR